MTLLPLLLLDLVQSLRDRKGLKFNQTPLRKKIIYFPPPSRNEIVSTIKYFQSHFKILIFILFYLEKK